MSYEAQHHDHLAVTGYFDGKSIAWAAAGAGLLMTIGGVVFWWFAWDALLALLEKLSPSE